MAITIKELINFPNGLAISWSDNKETFIDYVILRDNCPCANCSGESDIFGNVYKGAHVKKIGTAYELKNVIKVGHYAIRITWADGHGDVIFTYEFLRKLDYLKEAPYHTPVRRLNEAKANRELDVRWR